MPGKPFRKKGWKIYHALRKKGMSKSTAAAITSSKRGTRIKKRKRR